MNAELLDLLDIARVSFRQVVRTRPLGVIFSIAFGIAAFLILGVLGQEIRKKLGDDFLLMGGVNVLQVIMEDDKHPGAPFYFFSENTLQEIRKLDNVTYAGANLRWSPEYFQGIGARNVPLRVVGIDQYFVPIHFLTVEAGRAFTDDDVLRKRRICVLGHQAAIDLFGSPEQAVGKYISLKRNDNAMVIGVINGVMLASWTGYAFIPYTTAIERQICSSPAVDRIFVRADKWEKIPELAENIVKRVKELQTAPYVDTYFQKEQFKRIDATFFWLSLLLWMSILLSLLLGGFGIWSGTFTAVRGRTHEIGLKKAMGATNKDILAQFLLEALFKAVAGGLLGIAIGGVAVMVGIYYLQCPLPIVQLLACGAGSICFSALLGISGGIYPAAKASRMDVVDSLRFE